MEPKPQHQGPLGWTAWSAQTWSQHLWSGHPAVRQDPAGTRGPFDQMFLEPGQRQGRGSRGENSETWRGVFSGSLCGRGHCALKVDLGCVCVCVCACAHVCACVRPEVCQAVLWYLLHVLEKPRCQVLRLPGLGTRIRCGQGCVPSNAWRGGSCLLFPLPWMLAVFGLQIHPRDPVSSRAGSSRGLCLFSP